jgi:GT2 family glycosyltransferase/glycosyltransferase involved in cell wall biosynthesis
LSPFSGFKFLTTAARMAATAYSEGRLTASPARWLIDLRHLYGLMRESQAAAALPPEALTPVERDAFLAAARSRLASFLRDGRTLDLTPPAHPAVSVLLVLHNRAELTLGCIESLLAQADSSVELVIVDNASTDDTGVLLERLRGVRVIRSPENLGFLRACNLAAREAGGDYLLFLNNDTVLHAGSVAAALDTITRDSSIGAVGARLVHPDGRLQEAGSIIWSDGSCLGYGRGDSPWLAPYAFERDVDFCSAAFLLTPRSRFAALGGFDPRYEPAYYEDADYCVRLWKAGARVVYQPRALVTHLEFGSAASAARAVAMQLERRTAFVDAHRVWLDRQAAPTPAAPRRASARARPGLRILVVDDRVPRRSMGFGFPRAAALVSSLVQLGHSVTLLPTSAGDEDLEHAYADVPRCVEIVSGDVTQRVRDVFRERQGEYDVVLVSRSHNMEMLRARLGPPSAWMAGAAVIYDAEAVTAHREAARRRLQGEWLTEDEAVRLVRDEVALARDVGAVLAVSEAERAAFDTVCAGRVHLVGHALATAPSPARAGDRRGILFVGAFHQLSPNEDAARWFLTAVLPILRGRLGNGLTVTIAGPDPPETLTRLRGPGVEVTGGIPDLRPLYDRARVFIAPTRFAAGIPLKVLEAAANGVPAVVTPLLATQLAWTPGQELLTADDPQAFAEACARLFEDEALWTRIRRAALARIERDYAPEVCAARLRAVLEHVTMQAVVTRP